MKRGTDRHIKTLRLAEYLRIPRLHAVGVMEAFWLWVASAAPTGALGDGVRGHLGSTIGWEGESSALVEALQRAGLIDPHPIHMHVVHDWSEHATDSVHTTLARAGVLFADGRRPSTNGLKSEEREIAAARLDLAVEKFRLANPQSMEGPRPVHGRSMDGPREPLPLRFNGTNGTTTAPPPPLQRPLAGLIGEAKPPEVRNIQRKSREVASYEDQEALRQGIDLLARVLPGGWDYWLVKVTDGSAADGKKRCQPASLIEEMSVQHVTRSKRDVRVILGRMLRVGETTEEAVERAERELERERASGAMAHVRSA